MRRPAIASVGLILTVVVLVGPFVVRRLRGPDDRDRRSRETQTVA